MPGSTSLAGSVSGWVRRSYRSEDVGADVADAVAAALRPPGQIATLILPSDVSWGPGGAVGRPLPRRARAAVPDAAAAEALRSGEPCVLMLGGPTQRERGLRAASRIAEATGARVLTETFPARLQRGAGLPAFDRLGFSADDAVPQLCGARRMILAGRGLPLGFFGYPDRPSSFVPDGYEVHELGEPGQDVVEALEHLADRVAAGVEPRLQEYLRPGPHSGALTPDVVGDLVGRFLPEDAIVVEEAITAGPSTAQGTAGAPRHDWLTVTGGSIGYGIPAAVGGGVPRPEGGQPPGRRECHVHPAGAVDPGQGELRRHHGHPEQPVLRDHRG